MRTVPAPIVNAWNDGGVDDNGTGNFAFVGDDGKPHTRVTVEADWTLATTRTCGKFKWPPVRWWQKLADDQTETDIPNITNVSIQRSLENSAASCSITLANQWHLVNGVINLDPEELDLGRPGFFTFNRGDSQDGNALWGHSSNSWSDIIVPNALLRTYQGYGGFTDGIPDDIPTAEANGNLILTGVWLIDDLRINSKGEIQIECRDMGKLLIEQMIYPPLMPGKEYPLEFCRYEYPGEAGGNPDILYGSALPPLSGTYDRSDVIRYRRSSFDLNGLNLAEQGHYPTDALDLRTQTFWLSEAKPDADGVVWYEMTVGEEINYVGWSDAYIFDSNYQMFISIYQDGGWVSENDGAGDAIETPTGIPAVAKLGTNNGGVKVFKKVYHPEYIRFTFTRLWDTPWEDGAGDTHRAALSELSAGKTSTTLPAKEIIGGASLPDDQGYWLIGSDGGVFTLGPGAEFYGSSGGGGTDNPWTEIDITTTGQGYWTARQGGEVYAFGDAVHYGDASGLSLTAPISGIERSGDGLGYWLLGYDGAIYAYGSATYNGRGTGSSGLIVFADFTRRGSTNNQYWMLRTDGIVQHSTGTDHYGDSSTTTMVGTPITIASTPSGNGYYIATSSGEVYTFGDAIYNGGAQDLLLNDNISDMTVNDNGEYTLYAEDGGVFNFGTTFWGSLVDVYTWDTTHQVDGNYLDYTEIIKALLLWSGFWLYDPAYPATDPGVVFGNIEETGIYAEECLPPEMFDKLPVIDAINEIKQIVGYIFFIDETGAAIFQSPNYYKPGNFIIEDGTRTTYVPEINETKQLIDYTAQVTDMTTRSKIIISSSNPTDGLDDTVTTELTPDADQPWVRGMVKPLMIVNEALVDELEQRIMAELIASHLHAKKRGGRVRCTWNPEIQLGDQVRLWERVTSESYVHYVREISSNHDLISGQMTMELSTNWLGTDATDWIFVLADATRLQIAQLQLSIQADNYLNPDGAKPWEVNRHDD
jgi:hypothetical protein